MKVKTIVLSVALAFGLTTAASAGITPVAVGKTDSLIVKVAEGCGAGRWRGPGGRCHPFAAHRRCPIGYHIGPRGRRCWPN